MIKKVTIHAGHNPSGKVAAGAKGILDESTEARYLVKKLIPAFKEKGIKAVDCTENNGVSQSDVLQKICRKCNTENDVDLNISIHFNAGAGDLKGNGKITGSEVLLTENTSIKGDVAKRVCNQLELLGFKSRGVKVNRNLYFLNHTKKQAILIEICFVDDKDDAKLYNKKKDDIVKAIVKAVTNHNKYYK